MESLPPTIVLDPLFDSFKTSKTIELFEKLKIGRQVSVKTLPEVNNGYFESKVLSRNHAEIWFENGKVWIKDIKSSNGTYVNGTRLSLDGEESEAFELKSGDVLDLGIDILNDDNTILYRKVCAKVTVMPTVNHNHNLNSIKSKETRTKAVKKSKSKEFIFTSDSGAEADPNSSLPISANNSDSVNSINKELNGNPSATTSELIVQLKKQIKQTDEQTLILEDQIKFLKTLNYQLKYNQLKLINNTTNKNIVQLIDQIKLQ
ncbi:SMAD/FHA domain-containing protein [Conidiobolus coronatus NRRL 28638]|uniref:SMAD/FHA domain-containing protein n=1 Tax=Conidiobolus coronatus (strain ATCC 28846 / CBS 209.66 / NRRL 28638) TaxID=796925 RepID=A0A137PAC4_CONC2|nr:SMAD/FHA domain-containing protein [Conidiobolus coronatus NRRL 28638]|eukprot:KXN71881.1 SMAD/FHA domain-containing protein [Conidiobolus coronatus NRRL 28638]